MSKNGGRRGSYYRNLGVDRTSIHSNRATVDAELSIMKIDSTQLIREIDQKNDSEAILIQKYVDLPMYEAEY